jgi:DNA processing protein
MNNNYQALLHLSLINGIGPSTIHKIFSVLEPEQFHELYHYSSKDITEIFHVSSAQAILICDGLRKQHDVESELNLAQKYDIKIITFLDPEYPEALKQIHYPPPVLYVKGNLPVQHKALAVVGSRKANTYAQRVIDQIVPQLVAHDWHIVSGGALGADAMAHKATIAAGGKTIAVLGSGLLQLYPKSNLTLFKDVLAHNGALVSPYPVNMLALPGNFPGRNRVIAGLSQGCLVVQAAERSGASITASFALEQGREVFAIPGSIFDELSVGCHRLLQQGAKVVTQVDDILVEFGEKFQEQPGAESVQEDIFDYELTCEEKILFFCKSSPQPIDALVEQTGKSLHEMQSLLFDLQIGGKITQDLSGRWQSV